MTGSSHTAERNMTARKIVLFTNDRNVKHTCIDIYTAEITPVFVLVLAGFVLFISYNTSSRFQFRVVGYDFPVKTMSDSSWLPFGWREFMFYLCYLYLFTYTGVQHDFHIRLCLCGLAVTWQVSHVQQELLIPSGEPEFTPGF
jgi:hypothetical protein